MQASQTREHDRRPREPSPRAGRPSPSSRRASRRLARQGYLFILPFILIFLAFSIYPDIYSLVLSFEHYAGYGTATPVGLANYRSIVSYGGFWQEVENTLFYWVLHAVILIPLSFLVAVVVRSKFVRGKALWRPIIFLPQVMSIVAVSLVFQTLFEQQYGVINSIFGIHLAWLTNFTIARWVVVLLLVWQGLGFWFVVFLAGLTSIDPAVEEAAMMDGAGAVRRTLLVTVPLMRNVILFAVVIDAIGSVALYTQPNVLTAQGGTLAVPAVGTVSNLVISNLQAASFGQSAAAGWLLFILTILVSLVIFGLYRLTGGRVREDP